MAKVAPVPGLLEDVTSRCRNRRSLRGGGHVATTRPTSPQEGAGQPLRLAAQLCTRAVCARAIASPPLVTEC